MCPVQNSRQQVKSLLHLATDPIHYFYQNYKNNKTSKPIKRKMTYVYPNDTSRQKELKLFPP